MPCDAKVGSNQSSIRRAARLVARMLVASALGSGVARAQLPEVEIRERGCADFDRPAFEDLLRLELETIRSELFARPSRVALSCSADNVLIRVALEDGSAELERHLVPRAAERALKTRLLALTVSELLALLWREPPRVPAWNEDAPNELDAAPVEPSAAEQQRLVTYAAGTFRSMFEPRTTLFGGALGVQYELWRALSLGIEVEGLYGTVKSEHATVDLALGSVAFHAAVGGRFEDWTLRAGPGARIGWAHLSPTELEPNLLGHDVSGAWAGPLLGVRTSLALSRLVIVANAEAGLVTLPVVGTVDGRRPELELRGAWLGLSVGAGAGF